MTDFNDDNLYRNPEEGSEPSRTAPEQRTGQSSVPQSEWFGAKSLAVSASELLRPARTKWIQSKQLWPKQL